MGMFCKQCQYDLSGCVSHACPECGRAFEPGNPNTVLTRPHSRISHTRLIFRIMLVVGLLAFGWHLQLPEAVMAYVAPPSYTDYRTTGILSEIQSIRSQLELYANQHHGYPTLTELQGWAIFTQRTDQAGNVGSGDAYPYGPYCQRPPINPFTQSDTLATPQTATRYDGWVYDEKTHEIFFVVPSREFMIDQDVDPASGFLVEEPPKRNRRRR